MNGVWRKRRRYNWDDIRILAARGWSRRVIAQRIGCDHNTVCVCLRSRIGSDEHPLGWVATADMLTSWEREHAARRP